MSDNRRSPPKDLPKRFWECVTTRESSDGVSVLLDGSPLKTPSGVLVFVDSALAPFVVEEWASQSKKIDPTTMPLTRLLNTALDGVSSDMQAVREDIIRYSSSDLLCYRADSPSALVERQRTHWDPWIDYCREELGCHFLVGEGVTPVEQPEGTVRSFGVHIRQIEDPVRLAATHVVTCLTGSAILAFAVYRGALNCSDAWTAAHIDEDWNIEQWGEDSEARVRRDSRFLEMNAACLVLGLSSEEQPK